MVLVYKKIYLIFFQIGKDGEDENNSDDSDTEFEDEASPVSNGIISNYHSIEEKRANLEKKLGNIIVLEINLRKLKFIFFVFFF